MAMSNHHFILPIGLWVRVFGKDLAGAALAWSLSCGYSQRADGATVICRVSQNGSQNGPLAWLAADAADWLGAQPGSWLALLQVVSPTWYSLGRHISWMVADFSQGTTPKRTRQNFMAFYDWALKVVSLTSTILLVRAGASPLIQK